MDADNDPDTPDAATRLLLRDTSCAAPNHSVLQSLTPVHSEEASKSISSTTSLPSLAYDVRPCMRLRHHDIDSTGADNPVLCTELAEDMHDRLKGSEQENMIDSSYMINQTRINEKHRAILVEWLVGACVQDHIT